MELTCCVCGKAVPHKVAEAIANAEYSKKEHTPVTGLVCDDCLKDIA